LSEVSGAFLVAIHDHPPSIDYKNLPTCYYQNMALKPKKRPRDPIQLAKLIGDIAIGEIEDLASIRKKSPPSRGRTGGMKGGAARAKKLTPGQRTDIARIAASARWKKSN
jgi:hypothetical protein